MPAKFAGRVRRSTAKTSGTTPPACCSTRAEYPGGSSPAFKSSADGDRPSLMKMMKCIRIHTGPIVNRHSVPPRGCRRIPPMSFYPLGGNENPSNCARISPLFWHFEANQLLRIAHVQSAVAQCRMRPGVTADLGAGQFLVFLEVLGRAGPGRRYPPASVACRRRCAAATA